MAGDRYQDQEFIGWLTVNLSLIFAKEGLEQFSDDEVKTFCNNIKRSIQSSSAPGPHTCNDKWKLKREWNKGQFSCQADHCDKWLYGIKGLYASAAPVEWDNSDLSQLSTDPWACAKLYMPHGCASHTSAKDCDIAALLTLYLRCSHFRGFFNNVDDCKKVKEIRNRMCHSRDMKATASSVTIDVTVITQFLQDMQNLKPQHHQACQEALQKINELLSGKLELSLNREYELRVLNTNLQNLVNEVDGLKTTVQHLSSMAQATSSDVSSNAGEIDKLKAEHQKINTQLMNTSKELVEVKSQTDSFNQFIKDHKISGVSTEKLSEVQDKIAGLEAQIQTQLKDLTDRVMTLEKNVGEMKLAIDEVSEKHKQSKKMAMDCRPIDIKDIQDRLIRLYHRTCQKTPLYPLRPEWKQHVASLFVLPSMKVTDPLGISKHHLIMGLDEGSDIKVTSIKDIFPPTGSRCTDIYIMGDAGTGKSTLCEYLVHLWVSFHTSSTQDPDSEERFMENYPLLFYISLREAKSWNVEDMIKSQLLLADVNVSRLLNDHSSLIILDGLDEYSLKQPSRTRFGSENLPVICHSGKCTVLTTSRPWKLELLRRELEDKIERQISIVGLDIESQKKLVGKVVELLNSKKNLDKNPADFITAVQRPRLDKFMKTPVLLMLMLGLWFSGEPLGGSQCEIYAKLIDKQIQFSEEVRGFSIDPQCQKAAANTPEVQHAEETPGQGLISLIFKDYPFIMRYIHLVQKVSRFAYGSLSSKDRTNSLVFSHEQMELNGMSHEEVIMCLDLGLLTQYKVLGEITQRLKSLSFIHKSHQEFFASIYLSQIRQADELKQLLDRDFTSLQQILEMGTVFIFVCGMNPTIARDISRFIMEKASGDARLEHYRQVNKDWFSTDPNRALVRQLQGLILTAIEEGTQNNHKITGMQLQDLYMKDTDDDFPPSRVLACTESLNLSHVKSLHIEDEGAISGDVLQQLLKETSTSLHKLVLWDTVASVEMIQAVVQQQQGRLQTLGLIHNEVKSVDFSHLNHTDLLAILSAPTNSLSLHGIVLTHSQLEFLCHHVSNSCYGEVRLGWLQCTTHGFNGTECNLRLVLSANKNLSRLRLFQLPLPEMPFVPDNLVECGIYYLPEPVFTSFISCLKRAEKLEMLGCGPLRSSSVVELAATLPHLQHLQYIVLIGINLSGQQQVVQAVGQLKKLDYIVLRDVTMSEEELRELLAALPSSHRVKVLLGGNRSSSQVTITGYNRRRDYVEKIRHNPHILVYRYEVEVKGDTCIVKEFWFHTKKQ